MPILGNYAKPSLGEGEFAVKVVSYKTKTRKTGTEALIVRVRTADNQDGEISFALTEDAFWKLAWFAEDAGVTKEELAKYDTSNDESHGILVGRVVRVIFKKSDKGYVDAKEFDHASETDVAAFPPEEVPF